MHSLRPSKNIIRASARVYASGTILKIYYRCFVVYLAIDRAVKVVLGIGVGCSKNIGDSKSLSRFLNRKIDLK